MGQMMTAWVKFAKTGNPNSGTLPTWPVINPDTQPIMRFGIDTRVENAPFYKDYLAMLEFSKTFNLFDALK
jgi:para-nitrobenzyl esterase